ncbi:helix-turn-helix domain-containing protein, partial [Streptomyces flaveolus]
ARELHLNRQTLYNRLARIGELLGTDLDDSPRGAPAALFDHGTSRKELAG